MYTVREIGGAGRPNATVRDTGGLTKRAAVTMVNTIRATAAMQRNTTPSKVPLSKYGSTYLVG